MGTQGGRYRATDAHVIVFGLCLLALKVARVCERAEALFESRSMVYVAVSPACSG